MEFNRITRIFVTILRQSGPQLAAFFLMFVVIFLGFSLGGNLLFGRVLRNYSTIIRSLQECGSMLLGTQIHEFFSIHFLGMFFELPGKFVFADLLRVQPLLGGAFFLLFMCSCYMILMNVFMTILNDSITTCDRKQEVSSHLYSATHLKY